MKTTQLILLLLFTLITSTSHTTEKPQNITIAVGNFEPFFMPDKDDGLFIEVIRAVYAQLPEYRIELLYMSNDRIARELRLGRVDAAANIMSAANQNHIKLSLPIFRYSDVAISLKSKRICINDFDDLTKHSLATFQGATEFFGEDYKAAIEQNKDYNEYAHVDTTIRQLAKGRVEVIIIDVHMVPFFIEKYLKGQLTLDELRFHYIFPVPTAHSYMGFNDPKLRDDFDQAFIEIKQSGAYEAIYDRYFSMKTR